MAACWRDQTGFVGLCLNPANWRGLSILMRDLLGAFHSAERTTVLRFLEGQFSQRPHPRFALVANARISPNLLKNNVLQGMAQVFFQEIIKRMVGAFEDRARELYG